MKNRLGLILAIGMSLGVAACDTDYGSVDKDPYPFNVPVGGVWTGTFSYTPPVSATVPTPTAQTVSVVMAATETNEFWVVEVNQTTGCAHIGYGSAYSKQSAISGGYGYGDTCVFDDGSTQGSGTISGTAVSHKTLTLSFDETTAAGNSYATFAPDFTFQSLYLEGSALATLAGSYTDGAGNAVSIDSSGTISGSGVGTCASASKISLINSTYNLYRVTYTLSGCTATGDQKLNGVTLSGLGYLDDTSTTAAHQFIYTLHGTETDGTPVVASDAFTAS